MYRDSHWVLHLYLWTFAKLCLVNVITSSQQRKFVLKQFLILYTLIFDIQLKISLMTIDLKLFHIIFCIAISQVCKHISISKHKYNNITTIWSIFQCFDKCNCQNLLSLFSHFFIGIIKIFGPSFFLSLSLHLFCNYLLHFPCLKLSLFSILLSLNYTPKMVLYVS